MINRWTYKPKPNDEQVDELASELNINHQLAGILFQRGITGFKMAEDFFRPALDNLHDPFVMADMHSAIDRIVHAIKNREKILIYGDYDVDGTTAVSLVYGFFRHFHDLIDYYLPDRYKEGYGLSKEGVEYAEQNEFDLIISLDCGIKAIDMVDYANSLGLDMIICDHHLPGESLPNAVAILDPKRPDCPYPYKELSGCGVGFKLIQAYCLHNQLNPDFLYDYLDLVAVSIASDIVPITGENRILTFHGLKILNENPRPGLEALIRQADIKGEINISSIVFGIGPRINASGRMAHAKGAVEILLADRIDKAMAMAEKLNDKNDERRNFDMTITTEALSMIEEGNLVGDSKTTVLFKNDWHKGVIGIVASRCLDKFYKPTVILTESNGMATGSARSVDGFDVYEAISQCSDLLEQFGGHMYAAGLTMELEKIDLFKKRFEEVVSKTISEEQLVPQIEVDAEVDLKALTKKFYNILSQMAPFGPGNNQPVFVSKNLKITGRPRVLKEQHLKFNVQQEDSDEMFEAIGFGMAEYADLIGSGMRFKMAYHLEENNFMGRSNLQLRVKDVKFE